MISPTDGSNVSTSETTFTNSRQIAFMTLKSNDVANGTTTGAVKDAPLNPMPPNKTQLYLNIALDTDYDGIIGKGAANSSTWLPVFSPATPSGFTGTGGGGTTTSGVALWANCNSSNTSNSNFWVHTY
jgi:hypothetical protein